MPARRGTVVVGALAGGARRRDPPRCRRPRLARARLGRFRCRHSRLPRYCRRGRQKCRAASRTFPVRTSAPDCRTRRTQGPAPDPTGRATCSCRSVRRPTQTTHRDRSRRRWSIPRCAPRGALPTLRSCDRDRGDRWSASPAPPARSPRRTATNVAQITEERPGTQYSSSSSKSPPLRAGTGWPRPPRPEVSAGVPGAG